MTRFASLLIVALLATTVQSADDAPNAKVLADMGLAGLQILSDDEAESIRGQGFEPGSHLAGSASYELSKTEFRERVAEFRERIKNHTYAGAAGLAESKEKFRTQVQKFHDAVSTFRHKIH